MGPAELRAAVERAPLAWLPIGTLEFHGEHLPVGVDSFAAHALCLRAAEIAGGVVLPPVYLASGCLDLPFTLTFDRAVVETWVRATIVQLASRGFRAVVVLTGHGPLDLNHLLKRVCAETAEASPGLRTYGLCWLELNAARLEAPETGEPTTVDHAARIETSWMLELEPELVHLERLSDDPEAQQVGIYGRNPRFTASADWGCESIARAAALLAERATDLLAGRALDPLADLRRFVEYAWPEPLVLSATGRSLALFNPGRSSRYLSGLELWLDGKPIDSAAVTLRNESHGEVGAPVRAADLGRESGFYIRRGQTATAELGIELEPGRHGVRLRLGLGGVAELELEELLRLA